MNRFTLPLSLGVAIVCPMFIAGTALAQQEADAKALLQESAIAITNLKGLSFTAKRSLAGAPELSLGANGEVKFIRNTTVPTASMFYAKGDQTKPLSNEKASLEGGFDGQISSWVDDAAKAVQEKRTAAGDSREAATVKRIKDQLLPTAFFESVPFEKELKADKLVIDGTQDIGGVKCKVIKAYFTASQRVTLVCVADSDKLPRKIEQLSPMKNGNAAYTIELTNVKVSDFKASDMNTPDREGFKRNIAAPAAQPVPPPSLDPTAPTNNQDSDPNKKIGVEKLDGAPKFPANPALPRGGLAAGSPAPSFELSSADGQKTSLASLQGKVTVLCFFGTKFGSSKSALAAASDAAQANGANVFAVSCKDASTEAAKGFMTQHGLTMPLLLQGESVADAFKLRGYPSLVVIGADGKVVATLEAAQNAEEVAAAIKSAGGAK